MKIALLGQFGSGNSGNDGSLEAMILFLKRRQPSATILCVCPEPETIRDRYGIEATSIRSPLPKGLLAIANRLPGHLPRRIAGMYDAYWQLRDVDVLMFPGTGILDDYQENALGWPAKILLWCAAARARGIPIAFISVGAGPIAGWASRVLLKRAAASADYRSYRDEGSLTFMKGIGLDVTRDHRFPDMAFGISEPAASSSPNTPRPTIGIGIMDYRGWRKTSPDAEDIYFQYVAKIAKVTGHLLRSGHAIRLFIGDTGDKIALRDVVREISSHTDHTDRQGLTATETSSLHEILQEMALVDVAIVSRYHSLICALKANRPVASIGYASKNEDLMGEFGQRRFCQHIETFDVSVLLQQVDDLLGHAAEIKHQLAMQNEAVSNRLTDQENYLACRFLTDPDLRRMIHSTALSTQEFVPFQDELPKLRVAAIAAQRWFVSFSAAKTWRLAK